MNGQRSDRTMGDLNRWSLLISALVTLCILPSCHGGTKMEVRSMHIHSRVSSRFARTFITTVIQNVINSSQEAIFEMELPKTAFITNFTISSGRTMENFKISANVGPLCTATFKLVYEELLKRRLGSYEFYLRIRPKELVENFHISVDITEPQGISFLKAVGTFMTNELSDGVRINRTENKAHVEFKPTLHQQRRCPNCAGTLLDGDLRITYDVRREASAGRVQIINGYFVHYFAPANLKRLPKNVLFVIDHSGSMYGNKIKQTYEAFTKILEEMPREDYIGILIFDDKVESWRNRLVKATPSNIKKAKQFVKTMTARGGTDINKALLTAAKMLFNATINNMLPPRSASMILFLSDGEPTSGTTDHAKIIDNVKRSLAAQAALYCLGFGNSVDFNFLEKLALENGGLARRIYEDSDSALQLQGFYNEVANPMLLDIELQYLENSVDHVTRHSFKHYYQGSEIIVAGRISNNSVESLTAEIKAQGLSEPFSVTVETPMQEEDEVSRELRYIFGDFTERLWAYLTIEQLLTNRIAAGGEDKMKITEKALDLSMKYNFVTPLTSMVVTPPEMGKSDELVANKPQEEELEEVEDGVPDALLSLDSHYYGHYDMEESLDSDPLYSPDRLIMETIVSPEPICETFHIVLRNLNDTNRICFRITEAQNVTVNLFHHEMTGVTVNGKLSEDGSGFVGFGLVNKGARLKVDVNLNNIIIIQDQDVTLYDWTEAIDSPGILKKENEEVTFPLSIGANCTIARRNQSLLPSISIDGGYAVVNHTIGVVGQFINPGVRLSSDSLGIGPFTLPVHRLNACGEELHGNCHLVGLSLGNLLGGDGYIVPNIFTVPPK
ncbi:inter-alpha-trypsin inhibitor heavy chain H3-like isoform X2 [Eleutherodactylus coqui]|uniref:inter-alpha-trypsin inhibitor heavy chain H3-like isoform X2 n=1 Tax=Eleutherodactylus coqui TaxID=57060 RepID=UPI0034632F77